MKEKCVVLFSNGLDSRLAIKIMKEKGFEVFALYFKFPFSEDCEKEVRDFCKKEKIKLKISDFCKGKLLKEYLDVVKKAEHGRGVGINPCIDCKIFMLKKAREFADKKKIKFIVTGEVVGQRPMSQTKSKIDFIEKKSGIEKIIIRPLIDLGINGRRRDKQINLARRFKLDFPNPAGGCLLCEKALKKRFLFLLKRGINEKEVGLIGIGRHFSFDGCWVVIGRNEKENKIIEKMKTGKLIVPYFLGPSALILDKFKIETIKNVWDLINVYSKKENLKDRKKFEKWRL